MQKKLKGIIKERHLQKMLVDSAPNKRVVQHTMNNGTHYLVTEKSRFEVVPINGHYYRIYQVFGETTE